MCSLVVITNQPTFNRFCVFLKSHPGLGVLPVNP
jgi:hypothetical protein